MTIKSATIRMPQKRGYTPRRVGTSSGSRLFHSSFRGILSFLLLILFLALSVYTSYKVKSVANDISALEQRYSALQYENKQLNRQLDNITSKATLAKIGRRLGLRPPGENQIITLPE